MEQQGTVNKRTFVLLNLRSIVVTTIYHYITISFQILNELNVVTLSFGLQLAGLTSWEFTSSHLAGIHFAKHKKSREDDSSTIFHNVTRCVSPTPDGNYGQQMLYGVCRNSC
jgi:hypothetical protein